jgi:hypothetical protein
VDWLSIFRTERAVDIVDSRFLAGQQLRPSEAMSLHLSRVLIDSAVAFDPMFISAPQTTSLSSVGLTAGDALHLALSLPAPSAPEPPLVTPLGQPIPLPAPRPTQRGNRFVPDDRLFNDAQIASMKDRLNLRAEQELLWEAVEKELRGLSWRRSSSRGHGVAFALDMSSVQRLNLAYEKLARTLSEAQKRQVKLLMGIIGL